MYDSLAIENTVLYKSTSPVKSYETWQKPMFFCRDLKATINF